MAKALRVYLHRDLVGTLLHDEAGDMAFSYAVSWLNNHSAGAISQSLPLRPEPYNKAECRPYFAGVLPDDNKRRAIARVLGISAKNDFSMLEQIGGECAGAVTFVPIGAELPGSEGDYLPVSDQELVSIFEALPKRPLMAGERGVRLSLAGAQDKIAVRINDGGVFVPVNNAPSTHILKPAVADFEGMVHNEAYCMQLAREVGLPTALANVSTVQDVEYLRVQRYDRQLGDNGQIERLHQEDFCQALGVLPDNKYQNEGGPSLKQCFDLLRKASTTPGPDILALLNAVIFNYLIGNDDAHGRNFSLIYHRNRTVRFAPLYDLLCTAHYQNLEAKMAMKLGGEYSSNKVEIRHIERLADEVGLSSRLAIRRVSDMVNTVLDKTDVVAIHNSVQREIAELIQRRCKRLLDKLRSG